jgi:hypothetical protein
MNSKNNAIACARTTPKMWHFKDLQLDKEIIRRKKK